MGWVGSRFRDALHCRLLRLLKCKPSFLHTCLYLLFWLTTYTHTSAGFKPFMEYAGSYALFNYRLEDPSKGLEYDNLRLIRAFEAGLDPSSSEAGFVLVHIAMVKESGALVKGAADMLDACAARDRERFDDGLRTLVGGLSKVNAVMNSECMLSMYVLRDDD
jgi:hypothetical protein